MPEKKEISVACPCCDSRLWVDVLTGKLMRWRPASEVDESGKPKVEARDWDEVEGRVKGRLGTAGDKFEEGLSREKSRAQDLDDLFAKANEKLKKKEDEPDG